VSKWQHEVRHAAELGTVLRRAFKDAATPPTGPVFVSLPMDILDETGDVAVPARSQLALDSVGGSLDELADLLASSAPEGLALIAGDEIAIAGALDEMVALADALGARVYGAPLHSKTVFPPRHPLWSGALVPAAAALSGALSAFSRVFVVGAPAMLVYPYTPGPAVPESVELLHLSADPAQPGRTHAVRLGVTGGIRATLAALSPLVRDRVDAERVTAARDRAATDRPASIESFDAMARDRYSAAPMNPMAAVHALLAAAPPNTVVVDEAVTTGGYVRGFQLEGSPGSYYFCAGGGLGWGMPAALGVQLAEPERRVIAIVGDGSAMYAVQSLWTAAHYRLPVLFAIVNNRQYAILKGNLMGMGGRSAAAGEFVGMDIDDPPIDYVALARGMGVDGALVEKAADVTDAARAALASGKPWLLELPIAAR
jgi:benzoylformate decarboxylase